MYISLRSRLQKKEVHALGSDVLLRTHLRRLFLLLVLVLALAVTGIYAGVSYAQESTLTMEPSGAEGDFPGSSQTGATTNGIVRVGTMSTGNLTAEADTCDQSDFASKSEYRECVKTAGDYWRLDVQEGRSYRVQLTLTGQSLTSTVGGSLGYGFENTDGTISLYGDGDDFRDDGLAFIHLNNVGGSDQIPSRRYFVHVFATDLWNEDSRTFTGGYELTLTDITGVELMVENTYFDEEAITKSSNLEERESDDDVGRRFSIAIRPGPHSRGYVIDRIHVLLTADGAAQKSPFVEVYSGLNDPGSSATPLCRTRDMANFGDPEPRFDSTKVYQVPLLAPGCRDVTLDPNATYRLVLHTSASVDGHQLSLTDSDNEYKYGSGWDISNTMRVQSGTGSWSDVTSGVPRFKVYAIPIPAGGL